MTSINSIIIDDEKGCVSNLEYYLSKYCSSINVVKTGRSADHLIQFLKDDISFKLAFLDIELYEQDIFSAISKIPNPTFDIVFVTAHEEYALKAFKVNVLDYILKPLNKESVINCYEKILRRYSTTQSSSTEKQVDFQAGYVVLRQGEKVYSVAYKDVVYLKANGAYTDVCFCSKDSFQSVTVSKHLNKYQDEYPSNIFYRVHRSFVINVHKISSVLKNKALNAKMCTGEYIPIARRRQADFLSTIRHDE